MAASVGAHHPNHLLLHCVIAPKNTEPSPSAKPGRSFESVEATTGEGRIRDSHNPGGRVQFVGTMRIPTRNDRLLRGFYQIQVRIQWAFAFFSASASGALALTMLRRFHPGIGTRCIRLPCGTSIPIQQFRRGARTPNHLATRCPAFGKRLGRNATHNQQGSQDYPPSKRQRQRISLSSCNELWNN